ncbi:LemA family protein [Spiroplasma sp. TIUS-1]|uniref:LemA family protein n=1 Tax=Spiroplasma sp. TIUS-1 TaxID=216963 RepID=UPI0013980306|nr:LemA family protein [Spiroplasma sp. TIUS-1]QHX35968.1 LemA family protein [Spiroplasma sp. TIUS-1]
MDKSYTQPQPVGATGGGKFAYWVICPIFTLGIWLIFLHVGRKNKIRKMGMKVDESESGIDIQLARRADTLTKLIDSVKSAIKFESDLLGKITELRSKASSGASVTEKSEINSEFDSIQRKVNVAMENYPDLKSNSNILKLQEAIRDVEDNIAASRRIYNSNVTAYNQQIIVWPNNVVAEKMQLQTKVLFVATKAQKQDIKIDLGLGI